MKFELDYLSIFIIDILIYIFIFFIVVIIYLSIYYVYCSSIFQLFIYHLSLIWMILHYTLFCITEIFNTNISQQIFDYKITFVNAQHKNTNSKGDFVKLSDLR